MNVWSSFLFQLLPFRWNTEPCGHAGGWGGKVTCGWGKDGGIKERAMFPGTSENSIPRNYNSIDQGSKELYRSLSIEGQPRQPYKNSGKSSFLNFLKWVLLCY